MCSVFWLFWLSRQYLPSDWLEIFVWECLIVAKGFSPQSPGQRVFMIFLVYCIVSLCNRVLSCPPALHYTFHTPMTRYSLFVLKVLLNTNKPNQTITSQSLDTWLTDCNLELYVYFPATQHILQQYLLYQTARIVFSSFQLLVVISLSINYTYQVRVNTV